MSAARFPWLATLVVLAAAGLMVGLGFWQLRRLHEKEAMLARFHAAQADHGEIAYPVATPAAIAAGLYHHARVTCAQVGAITPTAGRDADGRAGWVYVASCHQPSGAPALVVLGWSRDLVTPQWAGGAVQGTLGPTGKGIRLVAEPALAGLDTAARPDPRDIPNNHLAYAVQWFLFAATALVIYGLALWRRIALAPRCRETLAPGANRR